MPRYELVLTRDTTESAIVTVEADDLEDATDMVLDMENKGDLSDKWKPDCCVNGDRYFTNLDDYEG